MAIYFAGNTFGGEHGILEAPGEELPLIVSAFPGVYGEAHLIGQRIGREVRCQYQFSAPTAAASYQALKNISQLVGSTGQVQTDGTATTGAAPFNNCTLLPYELDPAAPKAGPYYNVVDGLWWCWIILKWRQRYT